MAKIDTIKAAARASAEAHAKDEGWEKPTIRVGEMTVLPTKRCIVPVRVTSGDGDDHCFEYRCDAEGQGSLWPVQCA
jgi:hypothetical protein